MSDGGDLEGHSSAEESASADSDSNFRLVIAPGTPMEVVDRFISRMDRPLRTPAEEHLPRGRRNGHCRVCGAHAELTDEHLPPRSAFNTQRMQETDPDVMLGSDDLEVVADGRIVQGGLRATVLCAPCNNFTGTRWAREYQGWVFRALQVFSRLPKTPNQIDDDELGSPHVTDMGFGKVRPGRFIRQVLSLILSVSGDATLGEENPVLRDLVLGGAPARLPDPMRLYLTLFGSSHAKIVGGPDGAWWYNHQDDEMRRVIEFDFPPFGFVLLLDGPPTEEIGVDISEFAELDPDAAVDWTATAIPIGFAHKPWPCDYRTRAQLIADRVPLDDEDPD